MRDFDGEILQKESEIGKNKAEMANVYDEFLNGMVEFFKVWYIEESKNIVVNNSEIAIKLGEDKLRELKNGVNVLVDEAQTIVQDNLYLEELWWHKKENNLTYSTYSSSLPDFFETRIKIIAGELGGIFEMHDFFKIPSEAMRNHSVDFVRKGQKIWYKRNLVISKSLMDVYKKYVQLIDKTKTLKYELQNVNDEKKKLNIGDIWDSL